MSGAVGWNRTHAPVSSSGHTLCGRRFTVAQARRFRLWPTVSPGQAPTCAHCLAQLARLGHPPDATTRQGLTDPAETPPPRPPPKASRPTLRGWREIGVILDLDAAKRRRAYLLAPRMPQEASQGLRRVSGRAKR